MAAIAKRSSEMAFLARAKKALVEAQTIDEVKSIRNRAEAIRASCKIASESLDVQNLATEVKFRAERRAGEMLRGVAFAQGKRRDVTTSSRDVTKFTHEEVGISRMQSSRWQQVASIPEEAFDQHIESAKESGRELTTKAVLMLAKRQPKPASTAPDELPTLSVALAMNSNKQTVQVDSLDVLAGMRFACIYADPPWQYGNQSTRASTDNHYDTMTVEQLCEMSVESLAADNAHLHLWTTNGFLRQAFDVIEAWGFEYRSCFVWVKPQMGIGNYWRLSHEFLLLGIRGDAKHFNDQSLRSWAEFKREEHSAKPEEVRMMIERASTGPYLELFGRKPIEGWTVFGNQIERRLFAG